MEELISVIVPIYKVEQFLPRCVDSLLEQEHKNLELILVDDGSPDKCGEICDKYAKKDSRIKVIHKQNGGLSDARNAGIKIAKGEFVAFIDSDDWVSPEYLSVMLQAIKELHCDICECNILRTDGDVKINQNECKGKKVYSVESALEELIMDREFHQYVWNKLYKRECIEGILFPKGKTNEDEFWTYQIFGNAKKIVKIENILYYYFQRQASIMGSAYNLKRLDALEAKELRQEYIDCYYPKLSELAKNNLFSFCIYSGQMTLKFLEGDSQKQAIDKISDIQLKCRPQKKELRQLAGSEKLWGILAVINFWKTCQLKNFLKKGF